jgi:DNA primase
MSDLVEILDSLDVEAWLDDQGILYKRTMGQSGAQLNIQECPNCGDRRWRTYMNAETGAGNCFVCDQKFGKWSFALAFHGGDKKATFESLKTTAKGAGWRPKKAHTAAIEMEEAVLPTSFPLPTPDGQNLVYLEDRGVTKELAAYFHLRYCEDGWWRFTKDDGKRSGQNFGGRVIIPVFDLDGRFVTFQGRDVLGESERKYLFPAKLPASGRFLYNGHNAVRAKRVVVGEGVFDVIALKVAIDGDMGLRDMVPVGTFGKHLSAGAPDGSDQLGAFIKLKADGLQEVVLCWDGEHSALEAAIRAGEQLRSIGLMIRIALLPAGKDPNEVPAEVVRAAIWRAEVLTPPLMVRWRLRNPYR